MKRLFLLLSAFFLNSCAADDFQVNALCPISSGHEISVQFEYDSAELNELAVRKLTEIARETRENGDRVCFLGELSYRGVPAFQAKGAVDRMKSVAEIFLREGVAPSKLYAGITPGNPQVGFAEDQTAAQEKHMLNIFIGK